MLHCRLLHCLLAIGPLGGCLFGRNKGVKSLFLLFPLGGQTQRTSLNFASSKASGKAAWSTGIWNNLLQLDAKHRTMSTNIQFGHLVFDCRLSNMWAVSRGRTLHVGLSSSVFKHTLSLAMQKLCLLSKDVIPLGQLCGITLKLIFNISAKWQCWDWADSQKNVMFQHKEQNLASETKRQQMQSF